MSVRYSPDPRRARAVAVVADVRWLWLSLLVAAIGVMLASVAAAQPDVRVRKVTRVDKADTSQAVVREVRITHEGIRIEREDGDKTTKRIIIDGPGSDGRITIDADIHADSEAVFVYGDHSGDSRVTFLQDISVGPGEIVDGEVVAVFGSVRVEGAVESQIVSVFGNVTLGDSARAGADVVAVGGSVRAAPTARIRGDQVSLPFFGLPQWQQWVPVAFSGVLLGLSLLLGALCSVLFPERIGRIAETISQRTFLSLVLGSATFPLLPIVLILLSITFIGLPVALLLMLLFPVAQFVGYVAAAALFGSRLNNRPVQVQPIWPSVLIGMFLLGAFFASGIAIITYGGGGFTNIVGFSMLAVSGLMISVSVLLGTGALFLSRLGQPPRPAAGASAVPATGLTLPYSTP